MNLGMKTFMQIAVYGVRRDLIYKLLLYVDYKT